MVLPSSGPGQKFHRDRNTSCWAPRMVVKSIGEMGPPKIRETVGVGEIVFHLARYQVLILLMEEILHHLGCIKPFK